MRLKKLIIENYKCFQGTSEISFDTAVSEDRNVFLIGGMNGAGKTSILEAINISLYGERKEQIFTSISKKELEKGNPSISFELTLETDEGDELIIKRSWEADSVGGAFRAGDFQERLVVSKGGHRISVTDQAVWQDFLDVTIPKGVSQFFFFDGEKIQEMASDEDGESRLKASIEAVLGIEFVRRLLEDLNKVYRDEKRSLADVSDEDVRLHETQLEVLNKQLRELEDRRNEIKAEIEENEKKLKAEETEFRNIFGFDPESEVKKKRLEKERIELSTKLNEIQNIIKDFCKDVMPFALLGNSLEELKDTVDKEREQRKYQALVESAQGLADNVTEELFVPQSICCSRVLDESKKHEIKRKILSTILEFRSEDASISTSGPILNLSEAEEIKLLTCLEDYKKKFKTDFQVLVQQEDKFMRKIQGLDREINKLTVDSGSLTKFEGMQKSIENLSGMVGRKKQEYRENDKEITEKEKEIALKEKELTKLYEKYQGTKEQDSFLKKCQMVTQVLSEYIETLRRSKVAELKEHTLQMYRILASKGDLISEILVDEETFQADIKDKHGNLVNKQNLSAGEKEIYAISLLWGLARTTNYHLPVVIDTPLSRLDSSHRDAIVLDYFPQAGEQVIILSTDTEVDQNYSRQLEPHISKAIHLNFDKTRELTTIEEGYFWGE